MKKKDYHAMLGACVVGLIIIVFVGAKPGLCILIGIGVIVGILGPLVSRITEAQERQADALRSIADVLDMTFFDDADGPSDSTRIVNALEKLANTPPKSGQGTSETKPSDR